MRGPSDAVDIEGFSQKIELRRTQQEELRVLKKEAKNLRKLLGIKESSLQADLAAGSWENFKSSIQNELKDKGARPFVIEEVSCAFF